MKCLRLLLGILAYGWLSVAAAGAQTPTGAITGRVVDSTSQQPIVNVNVVIDGTGLHGTVIDEAGATRDTFTVAMP